LLAGRAGEGCLVVPDALSEAAQQALVDEGHARLVPRPAALATVWCAEHTQRFQGRGVEDEEGEPLGYLYAISLAMDRWEACALEIRARRYDGRTWLIPVRDRQPEGCELGVSGVGIALALAAAHGDTPEPVWRRVFGEQWLDKLLSGNRAGLSENELRAFRGYMKRGHSTQLRAGFAAWTAMRTLVEHSLGSPLGVSSEAERVLRRQVARMPTAAQRRHLGTIIDGSFASLPIGRGTRGTLLAQRLGGGATSPIVAKGGEAAKGAALIGLAIRLGLPTYRDTLVPLELHCHGRGPLGDPVTAWKLLLHARTVEAGRVYTSPTPVTGLKIRAGEQSLRLTLRRMGPNGEQLYRRVDASLREPTVRDENVHATAKLEPGQGFAAVLIESTRPDVLSAHLNWKTMAETSEPPPPTLGYLPHTTKIVANAALWRSAERDITACIEKLARRRFPVEFPLRYLLQHLNKWPRADKFDRQRGGTLVETEDIFRHYSVFPADGALDTVPDPALAEELRQALDKRYRTTPPGDERDIVERVSSWMYLAAPESVVAEVSHAFGRAATPARGPIDAAGLMLYRPEDLRRFYRSMRAEFARRDEGLNFWLRALRNIVRLREHALSPEALNRQTVELILEKTTSIAEVEIRARKFERIFKNCLLSVFYLLKRRRYEVDFLPPDSPAARRLLGLCEQVERYATKDDATTLARSLRKFLRMEATQADLLGVLQVDDGS